MTPEWLDRMRSVPVLRVAEALGMDPQPPRGSSGGAVTCPVCLATRRHTKTRDKRAAAGVRKDGYGWHCFQCDASGDALDLIACSLRGKRFPELADAGKAEVKAWCIKWLQLDISTHRGTDSFSANRPPRRPAVPTAPTPRLYPPADQVEALWAAARPVTTDASVASWLTAKRGLDANTIARLDLARILPRGIPSLPLWAGFGGTEEKPWRSWPSVGLQLVVPLHDARGTLRSVLFRRAFETKDGWPPKSIGTNGFERGGLVMANAVGRFLLAHEGPPPDAIDVVIEEGETDWLTGCVAWAAQNERAIFGITSGAWTDEIAQRLPESAKVIIRTDNDEAGDKLAALIANTLAKRCTVLRGGRKALRGDRQR